MLLFNQCGFNRYFQTRSSSPDHYRSIKVMEVRDEVIGSNNTVMEVRNEAMEVRIRLWKYMNEVNEVQ